MSLPPWLRVDAGDAPLIVSIPHAGTDIPPHLQGRFVSRDLAVRDADWWVRELYGFAAEIGATVVSTGLSRSVIDVNRDPSGASLYPGMATTGLCPTETFDGEPLYRRGHAPDAAEIALRRKIYFDPYHQALAGQIARLRTEHGAVALYDAHSIRSHVARLFEGELPQFNIGANDGRSCAPAMVAAVEAVCAASNRSRVTDGRFKGGFITRRYGAPDAGVHALQMELACRGYMTEPAAAFADWPAPFDPAVAAPLATTLREALLACLDFVRTLR
jgi:formiminoglutamase